jgi:AraC-like DNA-binding protein/mannose-6-phosphate isomerase-like protein (cupin superfamily)
MQTFYAYAGRDAAELRRGLAVRVNDAFTDGDLDIAPRAREVRAFIRTGLSGPVTFMHSLNGTDISFRRSWHHIRARKAAVRLMYFVLQGEMQVVSAAGSYAVTPGRCAVINADEPFYTQCAVPEGGSFESALAVVPEHLILSRMPWAKQLTTGFEVDASHQQVVTGLLELLCFEGDRLSRRAAEPLAEAFLESISDGVSDTLAGTVRGSSLVDRRFADIRECVRKYVTCADLTYEWVAQHCGISPRYLCYVLKANDTSFSELLWSERLPKARDWLVCEAFRRYPIHKIAGMAGFKSAAHFSRMFKSAYGVSPKDYRSARPMVARAAEAARLV